MCVCVCVNRNENGEKRVWAVCRYGKPGPLRNVSSRDDPGQPSHAASRSPAAQQLHPGTAGGVGGGGLWAANQTDDSVLQEAGSLSSSVQQSNRPLRLRCPLRPGFAQYLAGKSKNTCGGGIAPARKNSRVRPSYTKHRRDTRGPPRPPTSAPSPALAIRGVAGSGNHK